MRNNKYVYLGASVDTINLPKYLGASICSECKEIILSGQFDMLYVKKVETRVYSFEGT
jgi:hypothetical protein